MDKDIWETVTKNNMEGVIVKRPDGTYLNQWQKYKYYLENDFRIVGINSKIKLISAKGNT